jgi:hypothetical protein
MQAAVTEARNHVAPDATLLGAQLDRYADATLPPGFKPEGAPLDQIVWVVTFTAEFDICNPHGVCFSPRPGESAAVINATTGAWITTYGYSAP